MLKHNLRRMRDGVFPCLVGLIFIAIGVAAFTGLFHGLP